MESKNKTQKPESHWGQILVISMQSLTFEEVAQTNEHKYYILRCVNQDTRDPSNLNPYYIILLKKNNLTSHIYFLTRESKILSPKSFTGNLKTTI